MSNSNNPFLTEENNKDENNDQSNNSNNKPMDISAKFLEEAPSNAAPPPAYEDVVKPQPTLPAYDFQYNNYPQNDQSYLPPPFSPRTENYNQTNTRPVNSNKRRGGEHRGCCCCCVSSNRSRNKNCGCGWIIVFIVFIILTTISVANNNACRRLQMDNLQTFSFEPTTSTILGINVDSNNARIRGEVRIIQGQPTQQTIEIEVYTGSKGVTPIFEKSTQNGINELIISQTSGFSIFNIPPRCMRTLIDVSLPVTVPSTVRVRDLDILMSRNFGKYDQKITLITEDGDIFLNSIIAENIDLMTRDGTIILNYTNVDSMSIATDAGNIRGITTLTDGLSVSTVDGNVALIMDTLNANNAKINIGTNDGNVELRFDNSFSGTYDIMSRDGGIQIINDGNNSKLIDNHVIGNINNGRNELNITTDDGNIGVLF